MQDLGEVGGNSAGMAPIGINDLGYVVGTAFTAPGRYHAYRWTPSGGMQDLGTLGGANSTATGINARGQVSGNASRADGTVHAFLWTP